MANVHCLLAQLPHPESAGPQIVSKCVLGCLESACCGNSEGGIKYEQCLAQLRKRLGGDPEPGDKCGGCGYTWQ